jgi:hypothetical protein
MALTVLFCNQNLVLDVEVGDIVVKIDIFGDYKSTDDLVKDFRNEAKVS